MRWSLFDNNFNLRISLGKVDNVFFEVVAKFDLYVSFQEIPGHMQLFENGELFLHHSLVATPVFTVVENHLSALQDVGTDAVFRNRGKLLC